MEKNNLTMSAPNFLEDATGPVTIRLTNDYLFRALLQRNNKALKGLVCSLLHLEPAQIQSAVITNPIELGMAIDEKTFVLDVKVVLNDNVILNLEMQVINEHNWPERSLSYLCRAFGNVNAGEDYHKVKSVIQIGLLDFTLFPQYPEFYATYQFLNIRNHTVYSDKLRLSVVDLTHTDLATGEDRQYHIDKWAALFKATTWEEIKMHAQKDEYIQEASNTIYQLSQDENVRMQCEARDDYYRRQRSVQHYIEEQEAQLAKKDSRIVELDATIKERDSLIADLDTGLRERDSLIAQKESDLKERDSLIAQKESDLKERDSLIAQKESDLKERDSLIAQLRAEMERLRGN